MATLDLQVSVSSDDCSRVLAPPPGTFSLVELQLSVGRIGTVTHSDGSGMRFVVPIPQGTTITSAYLTLRCRPGTSATVVRSRISAEDVDDAITFADDAAAFDARWAARTAARVDWDNIPEWTSNAYYDSPEIKTVIQEVIDRAGWVPWNGMVIFWDDFDNRTTGTGSIRRYAMSYDRGITAPVLHIEFASVTPVITTQAVSDIALTTATGNGNITNLGAPCPSAYGVCWNTTGTPTISDSKTDEGTASKPGAFTSSMTGLSAGTKYYVRAYATNADGTVYGAEVSFTTLAIIKPTVTTDAATSVEETTATLNGTLDDDGREACNCGFEYGETTAYGTTTSTESKETGETFSQAISGLTPGKHYHFRAIATNSAGTTYGSDRQFFAKGGVKGNPNIDQRIYKHVERMDR